MKGKCVGRDAIVSLRRSHLTSWAVAVFRGGLEQVTLGSRAKHDKDVADKDNGWQGRRVRHFQETDI